MFDGILTVIGLAFLLFGLFVFFSAVLGLYRLDYVLNRMHAAAVGDALGIFCVLVGLICLHGWVFAGGKDAAGVFVPVADEPGGQPPDRGDGSIHHL